MIPEGALIPPDVEEAVQPSLTWKIDFERGRIVGKTDGLDAIKQAVIKILLTERFQHLIYDADYGVELSGLIGQNPIFVQSELRRRIREALTQDDRIEDVTDFQIDIAGDTATIRFTVVSIYGAFQEEVTIGV